VATLLAPFTPFVSETVWQNLAAGRGGRPDSVHLADYPTADAPAIDETLEAAMTAARGIVGLGRTVRVETKTRVRQPLAEAIVHYAGDHGAIEPLLGIVADELNVKRIEFAESSDQLGRWRAKPDYRTLGPALGPRVKQVALAFDADDGSLASALARGEEVTLALADGDVTISPGSVDLAQEVREGWGVASDAGLTVALDLSLTDDLRAEGTARELIRAIQEARKGAGLEVSDRIQLGLRMGPTVSEAVAAHRDTVVAETLAVDLIVGAVDGARLETTIDGEPVEITLEKAAFANPGTA
jgi:isoleucyl-tRNA synthetase